MSNTALAKEGKETNLTVMPQISIAMTPQQVLARVSLIQEVMAAVMKPGVHYGTIPGCGDKYVLYQPGAQVLAMTFMLAPDFEYEKSILENGHREYTVKCRLFSSSSSRAGMGLGSCCTLEPKYRYRNVADYTVLDDPIPKDAKERKKEYRAQGYGMKKLDDGSWAWVKYSDAQKSENPDIADTYNTVLKIAAKRAFVAAVITATSASDMFTQDLEDLQPVQQQPKKPKNPLLEEFLNLAYEVASKNHITLATITEKVEQRMGMRLADITEEEQADQAVTLLFLVNNELDPENYVNSPISVIGDDEFDQIVGPEYWEF